MKLMRSLESHPDTDIFSKRRKIYSICVDDRDDTVTEEVFILIPKCCTARATNKTRYLNVFYWIPKKTNPNHFSRFGEILPRSHGKKLCFEGMLCNGGRVTGEKDFLVH